MERFFISVIFASVKKFSLYLCILCKKFATYAAASLEGPPGADRTLSLRDLWVSKGEQKEK